MKFNFLLLALLSLFVISCSSSNEPEKENDNLLLLKASQNSVDSAVAALYSTIKTSCQTVFDSNFTETAIKNEYAKWMKQNAVKAKKAIEEIRQQHRVATKQWLDELGTTKVSDR